MWHCVVWWTGSNILEEPGACITWRQTSRKTVISVMPESYRDVLLLKTGTLSYLMPQRSIWIILCYISHWMFSLHSQPVSIVESFLHLGRLWSAWSDSSSKKSGTRNGIGAVIIWHHGPAERGRQAASAGTPTAWCWYRSGASVQQAESICKCRKSDSLRVPFFLRLSSDSWNFVIVVQTVCITKLLQMLLITL